MSSSDTAMFNALVERIDRLEEQMARVLGRVEGKDMQAELYGTEQPNHTEEREALRRGPGRPPGSGVR